MVDGFMGRKRREELGTGQGGDGCGPIDTGLSVQPLDQEGSERSPDLLRGESDELLVDALIDSFMRSQDGRSSSPSRGENNNTTLHSDSGGLHSSSERNGSDSLGSKERILQSFEDSEFTQFANVPHGYREPTEETNPGVEPVGVRNELSVLSDSPVEMFNRVYTKSLKVREEILDLPTPHYADETYIDILRLKESAAASTLNMGIKVDENRLRHKQTDVVSKLYEEIKREKEAKIISNS